MTLARAAGDRAGVELSFTVFDDGSTDGTAEALARHGFDMNLVKGNGSAYWANGMAQAEAAALEQIQEGDDQYLLWLNDDVALDSNAFTVLGEVASACPRAVVVGATREPVQGVTSYSGLRRHGLHPLSFRMTEPTDSPQRVDAFNGNVVAVPVEVARKVGGIEGRFSHAFADIEYGTRCGHEGIAIILAPGTIGACSRGGPTPAGTVAERWSQFTGRKGGGNFSSLRLFLRRDHPISWFLIVASTYANWWLRQIPNVIRAVRVVR